MLIFLPSSAWCKSHMVMSANYSVRIFRPIKRCETPLSLCLLPEQMVSAAIRTLFS
uniref:Uncharacterized protein n=1 Tax=Anguilla anguilla TaxID=7936 RepID=A0A0E9UQJ8_ANGAN